MPSERTFSDGEFTAKDLENSIPFDPDKRLRGDAATALLDEVLVILEGQEKRARPRTRARKVQDVERARITVDTFLANLVSAAFNRVDGSKFVAVPFGTSAFSGLPLVPTVMRTIRDTLHREGLIEGQRGFLKVDRYEHDNLFTRLTRVRATTPLLERFESLRVDRGSIIRRAERGVVVMKDGAPELGPEPDEVTGSRAVLERMNARLARATIDIPQDAWDRIRLNDDQANEDDDKEAYRAYSGDQSAVVLRRVFNRQWERGGRLYGGWWMHVPKGERSSITIDGEQSIELDYSRLHPTLLFHRAEKRLKFDPYELEGPHGPYSRDLGKRTFARLINKTSAKRGMNVTMNGQQQDRDLLPPKAKFRPYFHLFLQRLEPIAEWFGTGVGMELQREDSDIAVAVLDRLDKANVVVLPVHDSFITQRKHEVDLRGAMREAFKETYDFYPDIK